MDTLVRAIVLVFGLALSLSQGGWARDSTDLGTGVEDDHLLCPERW